MLLLIYFNHNQYKNYRRHNVIKHFANKGATIFDFKVDELPKKSFDTLLFEGPCDKAEEISSNYPNAKIVFDRTDNWSANNPSGEEWLLNHSNVIINSSLYLYNDSQKYSQAKCYYIPNATNSTQWKHSNKEKIAIYTGFSSAKVDKIAIKALMDNNPSWKFKSIGCDLRDIPGMEYIEPINYNRCLIEMGKCKIGLCLLNKTDWANGMLCLKVFDYIKEGLAVVNNSVNVERDIPNIIQYSPNLNLDDIDWNSITDKVPDKYTYRTTLKQMEEIIGM